MRVLLYYFNGSARPALLVHSLVAESERESFLRENHKERTPQDARVLKTINSPPASTIDMGNVRIHAAKIFRIVVA